MAQVNGFNIIWTPEAKDKDVEAQIELALEVQYFTNAWLQGKLSSNDYLEYAEWREVDILHLLDQAKKTKGIELWYKI